MFTVSRKFVLGCSAALAALTLATGAYAQQRSFNVPSQEAVRAIPEFARQAGIQIIAPSAQLRGVRTPTVQGDLDTRAALAILLRGTGLEIATDNGSVIVLRRSAGRQDRGSDARAEEIFSLPEVLVEASGSLNADIRRTENDIQPYVVFGREEIQGSQATNLEDFLNSRLPMNASRGTASRNQPAGDGGNRSSFNLRGLGTSQTLILVNGRRAPGVSTLATGDLAQPDINGIPISAIERIEVLPATASGIYGGGATGGVINIILRKDFQGGEVRVAYDNTFDTDSARRRFDLSWGGSFNEGRTEVMLSASATDGNDLLVGDRDFAWSSRQAFARNAPDLANDPFVFISGAQTNISSMDGTNLVLRDGTPFNSMIASVPGGYNGGDGGQGLLAGAGVRNFDIPNDFTGRLQGLSAVPETQAYNVTVRHEFSDVLDGYVDFGATRNKGVTRWSGLSNSAFLAPEDPGNPFNNYILVTYPLTDVLSPSVSTSETVRTNAGAILALPTAWRASLDVNLSRSTNTTRQLSAPYDRWAVNAAMADGSLNPFVDLSASPLDFTPYQGPDPVAAYGPAVTTLSEYTLRLGGPAARLPGGDLGLSMLASYREEEAESTLGESISSEGYIFYPSRDQQVGSLYLEATAPVIGAAQNIAGVRSLDLQFSARYDHYTTRSVPITRLEIPDVDSPRPPYSYSTSEFDSTSFTAGVRYVPFDDLVVRASYGTGFLPPSLAQIASFEYEGIFYVADPRRSGTYDLTDIVPVVSGGSSDLRPEQSESTSVGLIYTPRFLNGLRASIDYVRIEKTDEIVSLPIDILLQYEDQIPGRITRGERLPTDPDDYAGVITAVDTTLINIASSSVEAVDIQLDYDFDLGSRGNLTVYALASVQTSFEQQVIPGGPSVDRVGFSDGPLRWRGNLGAEWRRGSLSLAASAQYYDGYKIYGSADPDYLISYTTLVQGGNDIPSQMYVDISSRYEFSGNLEGLGVSVGVRNLFNESPPVIAGYEASGGYSTYGDPRLRTYSISLSKRF